MFKFWGVFWLFLDFRGILVIFRFWVIQVNFQVYGVILVIFKVSWVISVIFQVYVVFWLIFTFQRYFGNFRFQFGQFLGFGGISVIFQISGVFQSFLGFRSISFNFQVQRVFWPIFMFRGYFLDFRDILVIFRF